MNYVVIQHLFSTNSEFSLTPAPQRTSYSIEFYLHLLFFVLLFFFHLIFHHLYFYYYYYTFLSKWKRERKKLGHHTNCDARLDRSCIRCYFKLIWVGKFSACLMFSLLHFHISLCWLYNNNNNNWRPEHDYCSRPIDGKPSF